MPVKVLVSCAPTTWAIDVCAACEGSRLRRVTVAGPDPHPNRLACLDCGHELRFRIAQCQQCHTDIYVAESSDDVWSTQPVFLCTPCAMRAADMIRELGGMMSLVPPAMSTRRTHTGEQN